MPDDSVSTTEVPASGVATEPVAVGTISWEPKGPAQNVGPFGGDDTDAEGDDVWPARSPRRGLRLKYPTAVLLALLIGAGGLWGGAALQRGQGTGTTGAAASAFSRLASGGFSFTRGSSGSSRSSIPGSASLSAAAGIVTVIQGDTLYVTTASGGLVKVILGKSTTYTRNAKSTASALQPGDTVIVQGTKAKNGTVSATSVADTAAGLSATG